MVITPHYKQHGHEHNADKRRDRFYILFACNWSSEVGCDFFFLVASRINFRNRFLIYSESHKSKLLLLFLNSTSVLRIVESFETAVGILAIKNNNPNTSKILLVSKLFVQNPWNGN